MGGARRYPYPKWVWSPAGGWWYENPNWRRNTVLWFGLLGMTSYAFCSYSEQRRTIYLPATRQVIFPKLDARYVPQSEEEKQEKQRQEELAASENPMLRRMQELESNPELREQLTARVQKAVKDREELLADLAELKRVRVEIDNIRGDQH